MKFVVTLLLLQLPRGLKTKRNTYSLSFVQLPVVVVGRPLVLCRWWGDRATSS